MRMESLGQERRFTVDEVLRMVATGILGEDEPLELLDGRLVVVSPQGHAHFWCVTRLAQRLRAVVDPSATTVLEEKPVRLGPHDLPEPDVSLIRGVLDDYDRLPTADDLLLAVEVSVTSQRADRTKLALYAARGVPECWLVDLASRRVEVHRGPLPDGRYGATWIAGEEDRLSVPGGATPIGVRSILPAR